jgi:hypothetical protein
VTLHKKAYMALRAAMSKNTPGSLMSHWNQKMLLQSVDGKLKHLLPGSTVVFDGMLTLPELPLSMCGASFFCLLALLKRFKGLEESSTVLMTPEFAKKWDEYIQQLKHHNIDTSKVLVSCFTLVLSFTLVWPNSLKVKQRRRHFYMCDHISQSLNGNQLMIFEVEKKLFMRSVPSFASDPIHCIADRFVIDMLLSSMS